MACPICFLPAYSGASLSNGEVVHVNCLQKLSEAIRDADRTLSFERTRVADLRGQLARHETYIWKMARFFGRGADLEDLKSRIKPAETSLRAAEIAFENVKAVLHHMRLKERDYSAGLQRHDVEMHIVTNVTGIDEAGR